MAIKRSLGASPRPEQPDEPPATESLFVAPMVSAWAAQFEKAEPRAAAAPCRIRHSDAGKCGRALSYGLLVPEDRTPVSLADTYRFHIGDLVHEEWQGAAAADNPSAEVEHRVTFGAPNEYGRVLSAGHGDLLVEVANALEDSTESLRYHVELKTINGYGFQRAIGLKGAAEGPRYTAKLQGAVNAYLADADVLVIMYLSLDVISAGNADKHRLADWERFGAEWRYDKETFSAWAEEELARFNEVVLLADSGLLADRSIPDPEIPPDARITDPAKGTWTVEADGRIFDNGYAWQCGYCAYRLRCIKDWSVGS